MISGCSGGGKSTLLTELARRGYAVVAEPGRRILAEERAGDGAALPWVDAAALARRALEMSIQDHAAACGLSFFDRGIVDAAVAIAATGGERPEAILAGARYEKVFLAPPWPEIYVKDEDRRHTLEQALRDFDRVQRAYADAGYAPVILPGDTITARADFVLLNLEKPNSRFSAEDSESGRRPRSRSKVR